MMMMLGYGSESLKNCEVVVVGNLQNNRSTMNLSMVEPCTSSMRKLLADSTEYHDDKIVGWHYLLLSYYSVIVLALAHIVGGKV